MGVPGQDGLAITLPRWDTVTLLYALSKAGIAVVCKRGEGLLRTSKRQAFVSAVRWWEERAAV